MTCQPESLSDGVIDQTLAEADRYSRAGDLATAAALYERVLGRRPDEVAALHGLGLVAHRRGHHQAAAALITQAIARAPAFAPAHQNLGAALLEMGRVADAADSFRRALTVNPHYTLALINLGGALRRLGQSREAETCYRRALTLAPDASRYQALGALLHDAGRYAEAADSYRSAVAMAPHRAEAHLGLGAALTGQGQPAAALASLRLALTCDPTHAEIHRAIGFAFKAKGQSDQACRAFEQARERKVLHHLRRRLASLRADPAAQPPASAKPARPDIILGLAIGYGPEALAPFVHSLHAAGVSAEVVLFVADVPEETNTFLLDHGIGVESFDTYRHFPFHLSASRYFRYDEYLTSPAATRRGGWGHVLLTDVADVVFQSDPFAAPLGDDVLFMLENRAVAIGQCPSNTAWVEEAFGHEVRAELAGLPISCSGTTIGSYRGILEYLVLVQRHLLEMNPLARHKVGIDQGVHNVLLHRRELSRFQAIENGTLVATLGHGVEAAVIQPDGRISLGDGVPIPILHQFNYQPAFWRAVQRRLGGTGSGAA